MYIADYPRSMNNVWLSGIFICLSVTAFAEQQVVSDQVEADSTAKILNQRIRQGEPIDSLWLVLDQFEKRYGSEQFLRVWAGALRGKLLIRERKLDSGIVVLDNTIAISKSHELHFWTASMLSDMGVAYDWMDQHEQALTHFIASKTYYEQAGDTDGMIRSALNMVSTFGQQEQMDQVMTYLDQILLQVPNSTDVDLQAYSYFVAASMHAEMAEEDAALSDKTDSLVAIGLEYAKKGNLSKRIGQLHMVNAVVSELRRQPYQSIAFSDSVLRYAEFIGPSAYWQSYMRKAEAYQSLGDYESAFRYLEKAWPYGASPYYEMIMEERKYEWNKSMGKYDEALAGLERLRHLETELLNAEKDETLREVEAKYQTEQQQQEIARLTQEQEIQQLRNQRQLLIFSLMIGFVVLLAVIIWLYYRQQLARNQEKLAIQKQQLLRSQLNPHFIFNALSSIRGYLFANADTKPAIEYLGKFARLMRNVLELSQQEWVTLEEEINALELYLQIQQLRHKNSFDYEIKIDPSIEASRVQIPPLTAQPFIENAIEHGLSQISQGGRVEVSCRLEEGKMFFSIQDNGIGIEHMVPRPNHQSMAMAIFRERLALLGRRMKATLTLEVEDLASRGDATGTRVSYYLPAKLARV